MRLVDHFPFSFVFEFGPGVLLALQESQFFAKLQEAVVAILRHGAVAERAEDGAVRLIDVAAIAKSTVRGKLVDIFKGTVEAFFRGPELKFAHTGRIDQQRA